MIRRFSSAVVCLGMLGLLAAGLVSVRSVAAEEVDVQQLVEQLKSGDETAYQAADRLASVRGAAVVKALTEAAGADDSELRWRAARALSDHGPAAAEAVPVLKENLKHSEVKVRGYSIHALGSIGKASKAVLPQMIEAVTDDDPLVRRSALLAVQKLEADPEVTIPLMVAALKDADSRVVSSVLQQLAERGEAAVPQLIKALEDPEATYWATIVAAEMGPVAAPAVPALIKVLDSRDAETRMQALVALGEIGSEANQAQPKTIELLENDPTGAVRYAAAFALAHLGDKSASAALQRAAGGDDPFLAMVATYGLAELNPDDKELAMRAARKLVSGLDHEDPQVRSVAARSLAQLDVPGDLVAPLLAAKLRDDDPTVSANIRAALISIGPEIIPRVIMALDREELRPHAVSILREFGPESKAAVRKLVSLLEMAEPALQEEILMTLGAIGPDAAPAVDQAVQQLQSENERVSLAAVYALGRMGPSAASAQEALLAKVANEEGFVQLASAWSVANIAPTNPQVARVAIPVLIEGLRDHSELIQAESAMALGQFGRQARSALPQLREAAKGGNEAANEAIKRVEGQ